MTTLSSAHAATSGLPSLLKSSTMTFDCVVVVPMVAGAWNVPFPLPSRIVTSAPAPLPAERDVEVAVTVEIGRRDAELVARQGDGLAGAPNPPRPLPKKQPDLLERLRHDTTMSRWPSLLKSATSAASGEPGIVNVVGAPNPPVPLPSRSRRCSRRPACVKTRSRWPSSLKSPFTAPNCSVVRAGDEARRTREADGRAGGDFRRRRRDRG